MCTPSTPAQRKQRKSRHWGPGLGGSGPHLGDLTVWMGDLGALCPHHWVQTKNQGPRATLLCLRVPDFFFLISHLVLIMKAFVRRWHSAF